MIEFKGECGHTIRARDEDAGGTVRCSYCGRSAGVPESAGDGLDFLFDDVDQADGDASPPSRGRRSRGWGFFPRTRAGEFNPFAVVLKLCYVALLLIIVIVVGRKFIIPLFQGDGLAQHLPRWNREDPAESEATPTPVEAAKPRPGLIGGVEPGIILVHSTPPGALVFVVKESDASPEGRIYRKENCKPCPGGVCKVRGREGRHVVEVALSIRSRTLKDYPGYVEFRRRIERSVTAAQRRRLAEEYLIPDGGTVLVDETMEQTYLVRQYRNIEVRYEQSVGVRALYLPRIAGEPGTGSTVERLLQMNLIPSEVKYVFDVSNVESELGLYGVPRADWAFVIAALERIGAIPYVTPDNQTRLFTININDGEFGETVIRNMSP